MPSRPAPTEFSERGSCSNGNGSSQHDHRSRGSKYVFANVAKLFRKVIPQLRGNLNTKYNLNEINEHFLKTCIYDAGAIGAYIGAELFRVPNLEISLIS